MHRRAGWLAAVLLLLVAQPGTAGWRSGAAERPLPDAAVVLRTMLRAPALIDYEGTKVISTVRGRTAETVTMLEAYKRLGKLRLEFLSPESVSGRLVIDDGAASWQYEPGMHLVVHGPSFVSGVGQPERAGAILRGYGVRILGREEVIGRSTMVVGLAAGRAGSHRQLWVDEVTGVPLRTEERDARGEIIYVSYFSRISYSLNLPPALFQFRRPAGARVVEFYLSGDPAGTPAELLRLARSPVIAPATLLGQYRFRDGRIAHHGAFSAAVATYSDGISVLTVFQTPSARMAFPAVGDPVMAGSGPARFLDLGYFRVLLWQRRGVNFAVLGNVPGAILLQAVDELNAAQPR
ncbi:MAG TPA: sigma-E factor regulatory protein RseB domain-containing protein [bacterium]